MSDTMISVILPVYNAEKYLRSTIRSVLNQTYSEFEIIAVNDGSTDHSLDILKEFADSRIRIIDKQNTGVSDTRNVGIEAAKGKYVCFLDSDDCLSPWYLQRMYDAATEKNADMVVCSYTPFRSSPVFDEKKADMVSVQSTETLVRAGVLTSAWTKLIRLTTLSKYHIQFDRNMTYGEDLFFCWKALLASDSVWFLDERLYGYRMTGSGATAKYHPNLYEKYKAAFSELKEFGKTVGKNDEYAMDMFFTTRMPSFVRMLVREKSSIKQKSKRLRMILEDDIIEKYLTEWTQIEQTAAPSQILLYKLCREKQNAGILFWGYRTEAERQIKDIAGKIIWKRAD